MDWKLVAPYAVPALVIALVARRFLKAQKPRAVRPGRLWIVPALLLVLTGLALSRGPVPSTIWIFGFALAAAMGGAFGWLRVHTLEFSLDAGTGAVTSKATAFGALVLLALLIVRFAVHYFLTGVRGGDLILWTNAALVFSSAMLAAQSIHTWVRARRMVAPPPSAPETAGRPPAAESGPA